MEMQRGALILVPAFSELYLLRREGYPVCLSFSGCSKSQILTLHSFFPQSRRKSSWFSSSLPFQRSETQRSCSFPAGNNIGVVQQKCHRFVFSQLENAKIFVRISQRPQAAALELLRAKSQNNQGSLAFVRLRMFLAPHWPCAARAWALSVLCKEGQG